MKPTQEEERNGDDQVTKLKSALSALITIAMTTSLTIGGAATSAKEIHGQDYYVSTTLMYVKPSGDIGGMDIKDGIGFAAALGREIESEFGQVKAEMEASYIPTESKDGGMELNTMNLLANARIGFNPNGINPYFGAGLGVARVSDGDDYDLAIAYQASVGVGYRLSKRMEVDLEYRYMASTEADLETGKADFGVHSVGTRLTMRF